jgi:hypothetical protein
MAVHTVTVQSGMEISQWSRDSMITHIHHTRRTLGHMAFRVGDQPVDQHRCRFAERVPRGTHFGQESTRHATDGKFPVCVVNMKKGERIVRKYALMTDE